jgi:deoxyribodipyrimidine photolyase-like uncharacterized protein
MASMRALEEQLEASGIQIPHEAIDEIEMFRQTVDEWWTRTEPAGSCRR